ncbi:Phage capsid [uncultured Caudovirales phage]|uniref:Phage capsid n=1 Tax=uncultured Caudovirales phage TaxID=2100421 RepID=A0A6J5NB45_9CAUD|nr:Phage capsid [uncultured Caudovirales phage]
MATGLTNTTSLNDLLPSIVAEALFVASEKSIMRGLVRNYSLAPGQGKTVTVPIYPKVTAAALTEATAPTQQQITTDGATLTVAEVGLTSTISDLAMMASASNVVSDIGRLMGEAIARSIDTDLLSNFKNFSTTVGGATTTATPALLFQAIAKLRSAGYDTSNDCAIVLHPNIAYDVASVLTSTFAAPASMVGNDALRNGFMGMIGGVPVYQSSLVETITSAGDYACGIFHRDALGLAVMKDITIETQRSALKRGWDIVGSAIYGHGELYDAAGVYGLFDSSIE